MSANTINAVAINGSDRNLANEFLLFPPIFLVDFFADISALSLKRFNSKCQTVLI